MSEQPERGDQFAPAHKGRKTGALRNEILTGLAAFLVLMAAIGSLNPAPATTDNAARSSTASAYGSARTAEPAATPAASASASAATSRVAPSPPAPALSPAAVVPTATAPQAPTPRKAGVVAGQLDHTLTPGSVFAAATAAEVCISGYSSGVRNVTTSTRRAVFGSYGISYPPPADAYELDHLIPLELGGDNAASNLWPQPYHGAGSADVKDHLENHLHALVCSGQVGLHIAQDAIAGDWASAAAKYNATAVVTAAAPTHSASASPTHTAAAVPDGGGATALCRDGSLSYAAHHQGACSHHGGVATFYK